MSLVFILVSSLAACGGETNENNIANPTDPNTVFQLFPSGFLSNGYSEFYTLSGSDTAGGTHTGNYSLQTQSQSVFNGEAAIPFAVLLQITNTQTGAFGSSSGYGYYSTSLNDLRNLGYESTTTGEMTVSATTTAIPLTGKINDFGDTGIYIDSTGERDVDTWQLSDGGNGRAKLTFYGTSTDQFGVTLSTSEETYLIDPDGTRISIEFRIYYPGSGITLTLSGNKT